MNKILLVDDERNVHYSFQRTLGEAFRIVSAFSGEEAIRKLRSEKPHLILLDVKLPGADGLETLQQIKGVDRVKPNTFASRSNSGVLALDVLRNLGATKIVLLGFDMHGTHFFGPYKNGCANTSEARRRVHLQQFKQWRMRNPNVDVVNATEGSALQCFPTARLDDYLRAASVPAAAA